MGTRHLHFVQLVVAVVVVVVVVVDDRDPHVPNEHADYSVSAAARTNHNICSISFANNRI